MLVFDERTGVLGEEELLKMVDIEFIRKKHFVEGWSIRKVAKNLGISRQSVRKALESSEIPHYKLTKPRICPVMDKYRGLIMSWLEADKEAPAKQRHTAKRMYDRLVEEYGFTGGESTVRHFVHKIKSINAEVFIPLTANWGEQAQVDWGEAVVKIAGVEKKVYLFCLRMRASQVSFAKAYPTQKMEAFLEGHAAAFQWLGGVPHHCVFDNQKTAVTKILSGPWRKEHELFSSLKAHYLFDADFCNPAKGNEKGSVENLVGYVRRNALVPVSDYADYAALNTHLARWSEKERERLWDTWLKEQEGLRPLPEKPYPCNVIKPAVVSKLSLVTFDRNRYSAPSRWVNQTVQVVASWDRVRIVAEGEVVAEHVRCYDRGETVVKLEHYLLALARKPRASMNALAVRRLGGVWEKARTRLCIRKDGYREFTRILMLNGEYRPEEVEKAVEVALDMGQVTEGVVRQLILNSNQEPIKSVAVPKALSNLALRPPDLSVYDLLALRSDDK
jgi:transposase